MEQSQMKYLNINPELGHLYRMNLFDSTEGLMGKLFILLASSSK